MKHASPVYTVGPGRAIIRNGLPMFYLQPIKTEKDYETALAAYDSNGSGDFDSDDEVDAAVDAGVAEFEDVAASFECPVIPLPKGRNG